MNPFLCKIELLPTPFLHALQGHLLFYSILTTLSQPYIISVFLVFIFKSLTSTSSRFPFHHILNSHKLSSLTANGFVAHTCKPLHSS